MFNSFFNSRARSMYLSFFSFSFNFILWSTGTANSTILQVLFFLFLFFFFFFVVDCYKVWSSCQDQVIRFYVKVTSEFKCLIHQDRYLVMHISFVYMVKFKFLARFPVDHVARPVVSNLILLLHQFTAFSFFVINHFVSITT